MYEYLLFTLQKVWHWFRDIRGFNFPQIFQSFQPKGEVLVTLTF